MYAWETRLTTRDTNRVVRPLEWGIEWTRLFDADGHPPAARAKKIDGRLVSALIALPVALTGDSKIEEFHSLAVRDLERGQGVGLPSGEAIARHVGEEPLSADEVGAAEAGWRGETPLWYYVLRELTSDVAATALAPSARGLSARCSSVSWIWTRPPCATRPKTGSPPFRSCNCSPGCRAGADTWRRARPGRSPPRRRLTGALASAGGHGTPR